MFSLDAESLMRVWPDFFYPAGSVIEAHQSIGLVLDGLGQPTANLLNSYADYTLRG
jgi:hypothetical protein